MIARVDDNGAVLDPVGANEFRFADGADDDIGLADEPRKVLGARMADRDGRIGLPRIGLRPTTTACLPGSGMP